MQSRTASVKASAGPSPEAVGTTVLSHVMTQKCARWSVLPDCTLGEEVVLPPSIVPETSARALVPALLGTLQTHVLGTYVQDWLAEVLRKVDFIICVMHADSASANFVVARTLRTMFCRRPQRLAQAVPQPCIQSEGWGLYLMQPCLIHQLMLALGASPLHKALSGPIGTMTSLLRLSRYRTGMQEGCRVHRPKQSMQRGLCCLRCLLVRLGQERSKDWWRMSAPS